MYRVAFTLVAAALVLGACGSALAGRGPAGAGPERTVTADAARTPPQAQLALGEQVFERVCTTCHSLEAPPRAAPPMTHVARHYRQAFTDEAAGVARIVEFVRNPSAEASALPAHARERWGLMPALQLSQAELEAVAGYIWQLPEPGRGMGGHRHGKREGQGHRHRHRHGG
jgi:cytochrome c